MGQEWYKTSVKNNTDIPGAIEQVERFTAWWNNNLATVVNYYDGYYRVFLLVAEIEKESNGVRYENDDGSVTEDFSNPSLWSYQVRTFPHNHSCNYWGEYSREEHNSSYDARSEASWLRRELSKGYGRYHDNPILLIHPGGEYFHEIVKEPYVVKKEVGVAQNGLASFRVAGNLDKNIKPFDIIKVLRKDEIFDIVPYYHVGVYLGDKRVFHFHDEHRKAWAKPRIDSIEDFWRGNNVHGHLVIYHPIVPFRNWEKALQNVVWTVDIAYGVGYYDKFTRNCEHLANTVVYGINHSEQVSKWKSFCLKNKISEGDNELGKLNNQSARDIRARIEVPPKGDCRIM